MRLFSASLLLPSISTWGRHLERPVGLIDRCYWRDFQREFPPDMPVLEKIPIQGQELYTVRAR